MKRDYQFAAIILLIIAFAACSGNKDSKTENDVMKEEIVDVVCLFDKLSVRAEPSKDSKWLSGLNLGEVARYLGESAIDSLDTDREYLKVELTDGTTGWSVSYGLAKNAQPAAIIEDAIVFERPDLVTKTDEEFIPVEFVAIISSKEDWIEVIGKRREKSGWIKEGSVSKDEKDVAVATLASKEDLLTEKGINKDKIKPFLADLPVNEGQLVTYLESIDVDVEEESTTVEISTDSLKIESE